MKSICLKATCTKKVCLYALVVVVLLAMAIGIGIAIGFTTFNKGILHDDQLIPPSELGIYPKSAVASDSVPCAAAGKEMLLKNGSAVDAAIATLLCMGVYNSQSSGIGGGLFMVIYNRTTGKTEVIDAREEAPGFATEGMYAGDEKLSFAGGLSVAVPGELKGMAVAHERHGRLPWSELFGPAIHLAENGFPAGMHLARALKNSRERILNSSSLREVFVNSLTGDVMKEGDLVKRPQLAETLKLIASKGPDEFYLGDTGKRFVKDVQEFGGNITTRDLANYRAIIKNSTVAKLKGGLTLYSVPPPGSGLVLSFILRVLDLFNMTHENLSGLSKSTITYQRFVEALKYGYAYRTKLGDEQFIDLKKVIAQLTSDKVVRQTKRNITDKETFEPKHYGAELSKDDYGTAHMSVVAPNGDAVSATTSINYWFGAGIRSPSTGIILNNEMDDFSAPHIINVFGLPPSVPNFIRPGKRPQSSMCPTIIVNQAGEVILVIGAAGGTRITSAVALTTMKIMMLEEDIKEAIDDARIHHQLIPNSIEYEARFSRDILDELLKIGHKLKTAKPFGSVVVGIKRREDGVLLANYDFRKGGSVSGF